MSQVQRNQQDAEGGEIIMMTHKHHLFRFVDSTPKESLLKAINNGGKVALGLYLKSIMYYYIAQHSLQSEMKGDETDYCNMLAEEFLE